MQRHSIFINENNQRRSMVWTNVSDLTNSIIEDAIDDTATDSSPDEAVAEDGSIGSGYTKIASIPIADSVHAAYDTANELQNVLASMDTNNIQVLAPDGSYTDLADAIRTAIQTQHSGKQINLTAGFIKVRLYTP